MCWIYRRNMDGTRGEYVDTSRYAGLFSTLSGIEALDIYSTPPKVLKKPRLPLVQDLREWRAWRRARLAGLHRQQNHP